MAHKAGGGYNFGLALSLVEAFAMFAVGSSWATEHTMVPGPRRWRYAAALAAVVAALAWLMWTRPANETPVEYPLHRSVVAPSADEPFLPMHYHIHVSTETPGLCTAKGDVNGWFLVGPMRLHGMYGVLHVRLRLKPITPIHFSDLLLMQVPPGTELGPYYPAELTSAEWLNHGMRRGEVRPQPDGTVEMNWNLERPAGFIGLTVPPGTSYRVVEIELRGPRSPPPADLLSVAGRGLVWIVPSLVLVLAAVQLAWRPFTADSRGVKYLLLAGLGASFAIMIFLLPPFQAPDEQLHWRDVLSRSRTNAMHETPLYYLPDYLRFVEVRFRVARPVPVQGFRAPLDQYDRLDAPQYTGYSHVHTYPVVALLAQVYPRVETVRDALIFYYLVRGIHAGLLLAMLVWANRNGWLPYTAIAVLAFPYVQQQCSVVSAETVPNLGSVLVVLMALAVYRRWTLSGYIALCVASLYVVLAKPPVYVFTLLVPLLLFPWSRIPRKRMVLPLAAVALFAAGYFAAVAIKERMTARDTPEHARHMQQQLEAMTTCTGLLCFLDALKMTVDWRYETLSSWMEPLGWVDTLLTREHMAVLRLLLFLALLADLLLALPYFPAISNGGRGLAAAVAAVLAVNLGGAALLQYFIMYVREHDVGHRGYISYVQVRYLFPPLLMLPLLPMMLGVGRAAAGEGGTWLSAYRAAVNTGALALFPLLLAASCTDLAVTLLGRYW